MEIAHPVGNGDMRIAAHLGAANFYAGAGEAGQRICLAKKSPNVSRQRSATISECRAGDRCKLVEQFCHGCGVRRTRVPRISVKVISTSRTSRKAAARKRSCRSIRSLFEEAPPHSARLRSLSRHCPITD